MSTPTPTNIEGLAGLIVALSVAVSIGVKKTLTFMADKKNGGSPKMVSEELCNERSKNMKESLARIEKTLGGIQKTLTKRE